MLMKLLNDQLTDWLSTESVLQRGAAMCLPPVTSHNKSLSKKNKKYSSAFLTHVFLKTLNPALTFQMDRRTRLSMI